MAWDYIPFQPEGCSRRSTDQSRMQDLASAGRQLDGFVLASSPSLLFCIAWAIISCRLRGWCGQWRRCLAYNRWWLCVASGTWGTNPADSTTDATRRTRRLLMGREQPSAVVPTVAIQGRLVAWEGRCCAPLGCGVADILKTGNFEACSGQSDCVLPSSLWRRWPSGRAGEVFRAMLPGS